MTTHVLRLRNSRSSAHWTLAWDEVGLTLRDAQGTAVFEGSVLSFGMCIDPYELFVRRRLFFQRSSGNLCFEPDEAAAADLSKFVLPLVSADTECRQARFRRSRRGIILGGAAMFCGLAGAGFLISNQTVLAVCMGTILVGGCIQTVIAARQMRQLRQLDIAIKNAYSLIRELPGSFDELIAPCESLRGHPPR